MTRRHLWPVLLLAAPVLVGCGGAPEPRLGLRPHCAVDGASLELNGFTGEEMLTCLDAVDLAGVTQVVLDSPGGSVGIALIIAERLAALDAEMVVRSRCHSSCANYFLPVARRIRLQPDATVILHGSVDGMLLENGASPDVFQAQADFAQRHGVSLGWLMYRDAGETSSGYGRYLSGAAQTWPEDAGAARIAFVMAEEAMMRSCLPGVEIEPFEDTGSQRLRADAQARERWRRLGVYPSGDLRCVTPGP